MALGQDCTRRRHSCRRARVGKRPLQVSRNDDLLISSSLSVGRMCVLAICLASMITNAPVASARSLNRNHLRHSVLSNLRGGDMPSGGDQQINDEDLDEYIDFLLAYADDKATEEDNPLFKNEDVSPLLDSIEESTAVEEEETLQEEQETEQVIASGLEPMVDDVHNDTQIDAMVDTLVASVDDAEVEVEEAVEHESSTIVEEPAVDAELEPEKPVKVALTAETDAVVEEEEPSTIESSSKSFFLGSSAVEEMPPPVVEEEPPKEAEVETETIEESKPNVGIFGSLMQKIGLKKEQEEAPAEEAAVEVEADVAVVEPVTEATIPVEDEGDLETIEEEEAVTADTTIVEPAEKTEKLTVVVDEIVEVESSETLLEPMQSESEASTPEEEAPKSKLNLMAPVTATMSTLSSAKTATIEAIGNTGAAAATAFGNTKTATVTALSNTGAAASTAFTNGKTATITALDNTSKSVVSSAKSYYQGASSAMLNVWSKRPFQSRPEPPERDYSKIYEKYFAANQEVEEEIVPTKSSRLGSAFLKPWGTVSKYLEPKQLLAGAEESYSIGIQGYVDEDTEIAHAEDETEQVPEADEVEAVVEEVAEDITEVEDAEAVTESIEVEVDIEEVVEVVEVEREVDEEEVPEDLEIIEEREEQVFEAEVEVEDAQLLIEDDVEVDAEESTTEAEDIVEHLTDTVEVVTDAEADIEDAEIAEVYEDAETEVEVDIEEVTEEPELPINGIEVESIVEDVDDIVDDIEEVDDEEVALTEITEEIDTGINVAEDSEIIEEDAGVEVAVEDVPEDTEVVTEILEPESEAIEVSEGLEDTIDILSAAGETPVETEDSVDSNDDTQTPRRPFLGRLWGTSKLPEPTPIDEEKVEDEMEEETADEIIEENLEGEEVDESIGHDEIAAEELPAKRNVFARLWGVSKGVSGSEAVEDVDIGEVDVSVSIVEDEESLDSLEISESSGEEDELDNLEIEESVGVEESRNVFQLHVPERRETTEESSLPQIEIVEVDDEISASEDAFESEEIQEVSIPEEEEEDSESEEIFTLQLHQEGSIIEEPEDIAPFDETVTDEPEMDLEYFPVDGVVEEDSEESSLSESAEVELSDIEEEAIFATAEGVESDQSVDLDEELDEEEEMEEILVADNFEVVAEESEDTVEQLDEEEEVEEVSFVPSVAEDSEDEEEVIEEIEEEEDISIELVEEEIVLEEEELDESEEEELVPVDEMDEDVSLVSEPYSLEVEMEEANFLTRFLVNKGLEQVVMVAILLAHWIRYYIIAPFLDSIEWIKAGKAQDLIETVMNTRGGALSMSESDDADEEDEEAEAEEEALSEEGADEATGDVGSESDAEKDEKKNSAEQDHLSEGTVSPEESLPAAPRVPPNFLFRRLLNYGYIGHVLIMEIILGLEWLKVYVPQVQAAIDFVSYDILKRKKRSGGPREPVNLMNSGFVNIGEGSRVGRKSKKMRKKEDQEALEQLQGIGDVQQAKYSYVSQSFMERHGIGPFNVAVSEVEVDYKQPKKKARKTADEEEDESDSGWIMDALGVEKDQDEDSNLSFQPNVGVSVGSSGPSVSVGFEMNLGGGSKKKSKGSSLRSVLETSSSTKPKKRKPKVTSDSESGLMGRLRAQGANSLVGRSILGAYPGDLPPPDEAADSRGVIDMAQRYGYGDWSDEDESDGFAFDDDDSEEDDFFEPKKSKKTKKRRTKSRQNIEIGASLDLGTSSQDPLPVASASTRKRTKTRSSASSLSVSSSIKESSRRRRKSRSSQLPSLAMEKLGTTSSASGSTTKPKPPADSTAKSLLSAAKEASKPKSLSPAMSLLDKAKKDDKKD